MKLRTYQPLFLILLLLSACKKEPEAVTRPVEFKTTTYKTLGTYDTSGVPNYLLPKDSIPPEMISYIQKNLPERTDLRITNPDLLTTKAIADIAIKQTSDVLITFVTQRTSVTNSIAFYTYPTSAPPASAKDIEEITYIFPNAGMNTKLQAGDKAKIGRFNAGTSIGFVLLRDGWDATGKTVDNKAVHFCSNDVLNPEVDPNLKKHAVLINYAPQNKVLIGFENTNRTNPNCDHDFNDVVIYATVTP